MGGPGGVANFALAAQVLPATSSGLLDLLSTRGEEIRDLIERGQLGAVYVPALLGKDAALALDDHAGDLPDHRRSQAVRAVRRIVLAAWQLDAFGDLGDREKVTSAYDLYASAIGELKAAYATR